jgi:hypothetical protein
VRRLEPEYHQERLPSMDVDEVDRVGGRDVVNPADGRSVDAVDNQRRIEVLPLADETCVFVKSWTRRFSVHVPFAEISRTISGGAQQGRECLRVDRKSR